MRKYMMFIVKSMFLKYFRGRQVIMGMFQWENAKPEGIFNRPRYRPYISIENF